MLTLPTSGHASPIFTFTKIADTNTPIPDGSGNFTGIGNPAISGGTVGFLGSGSGSQQGIYTGTGGTVAKIADTNTLTPNGSGNFSGFSNPAISGGTVAFFGFGSGQQGIFTGAGGTLSTVADTNTANPRREWKLYRLRHRQPYNQWRHSGLLRI